MRTAVAIACAADSRGLIHPDDWVDLATEIIGSGFDDPPLVDLAILNKPASRWSTDRPIADLCELLGIDQPDADAATLLIARAVADDLRARPETAITAPMIRIIARLAAANDYDSKLANECSYAEEFLDCDCLPDRVDPELEARLEGLPTLGLPDAILRAMTRTARASLPATQPRHGH